jgi:putative endonuclease
MPCCYILFSQKLNRYYVGATGESVEQRLEKHLRNIFGSRNYTAKAHDWSIFMEIPCASFEQSLKIEKHIKRMKSQKYIQDLKKYPEMVDNLIAKYAS